MFTIIYFPKFHREYKKLFISIQKQVRATIADLEINPFAPHLKTHKLQGKLQNFYACAVNYSYRIVFVIGSNQTISLRSVGDHSIYDRL